MNHLLPTGKPPFGFWGLLNKRGRESLFGLGFLQFFLEEKSNLSKHVLVMLGDMLPYEAVEKENETYLIQLLCA